VGGIMTAPEFTLLSDPAISGVTVEENGESMLDIRVAGLGSDARKTDDNPVLYRARTGVIARLLTAQSRLPEGYSLLIVECHRPVSLQLRYFTEYREELRASFPDWSEDRLHREASRYVSPPEVAPHCTGGAVDLTLCTDAGVELDMGTRLNASPVESANRCYTAASDIPAAARENREILGRPLTESGFVNYPTEWWHWSYGERYWAHSTGNPACYGPIGSGQDVLAGEMPERGGEEHAGIDE
jgi:D-alanyl-D-alanine dipeptidase